MDGVSWVRLLADSHRAPRMMPAAKKNPESLCSQKMNQIACFCKPEFARRMDFRSNKVHAREPNTPQPRLIDIVRYPNSLDRTD